MRRDAICLVYKYTFIHSFIHSLNFCFSVTISWFRRSQFPYIDFHVYGKKCIDLQLVFMFSFVDCPTWSNRNSETAGSKKESYCQKTSKSAIKTKVTRTCRGKEAYWCTNWALFGGVKWSCWRSWCWNTDWCLSWSTSFSIIYPCKEWSGCCNSNFGGRSMLSHFELKTANFVKKSYGVLALPVWMLQCTEFIQVLENLESPGSLVWHLPGLEIPGKRWLVLESSGNLLNSSKRYEVYGRQ